MESVENKLEQLVRGRVAVVGDVMLDRYWYGDTHRISPEAPVPVVSVERIEHRLGGAGNVALNISSLGGKCCLIGIVGEDAAGARISELAESAGLDCQLSCQHDLDTTVKLRVISRNQQLMRADFEDSPNPHVIGQMHRQYQSSLCDVDAIVLSDYGKGALNDAVSLIKLAAKANVKVAVDPKGNDFSRYTGASLVTPNLAEFEAVAGPVYGDESLREKAQNLISEHNLGALLVTRSQSGMTLFSKAAVPIHVQARSREIFDVSGAGDTVIALMAMSMASNIDLADALEFATRAAGIVVSKLGTAAVSIEELRSSFMADPGSRL